VVLVGPALAVDGSDPALGDRLPYVLIPERTVD
jgi:hypothetical protein